MSAIGESGYSKLECPQRHSERLPSALDEFTESGHRGARCRITPVWIGGIDPCWQNSN